MGIATENDDSTLLTEFYPENYFSHIIIDECHRSAWGKWSQVLTRNREAAHIGLTATPRQLKITGDSPEIQTDLEITANNLRYFVATTVDLLTTGVDVPCVRNIAFFKYLKSPISFYQMVGRGTRLDIPNEKMMFRVYDYTDATRLFGEAFISVAVKDKPPQPPPNPGNDDDEPRPDPPQEPIITVDGFTVHISDLGRFIVADVDGRAMPITVEDYCQRLTACLVQEVASLQQFRQRWINIPQRLELLDFLVSAGYSPKVVRLVRERDDYDLYDVLAELGWEMEALTRQDRADAFAYKQEDWLKTFPEATSGTIQAIARQFAKGGTEALESKELFKTLEIKAAGGFKALKLAGNPTELFLETKARIFAA